MKSKLLHTLLLVLVGIFPANLLLSQNKWVSPDYIRDGIPFMMSLNPCGLISMDTLSVSDISLRFNKNNGGLVNYHQSDNDYRIKVDANSIYRFNKKIVLRGAIDYSYYQGKNMSGSVFLNPYANAFDITEFDDVNKGDKKLDQYHILGELGYDVYKGLLLGASFDLVSANYSKMKDLRHSNTISDIRLDLALSYSIRNIVTIGASYHYRKSIEGIYYKRYSIADHMYSLLVTYGTFWGKRKSYDEMSGMITQNRVPVINTFNGGSLQINITPTEKFTLFIEGVYNSRKGSYGIKSPKSIQFYSHDGYDYAVAASAVIRPADSRHVISFRYSSSLVDNYENLYKIGITSTGSEQITYFDPVFAGKTLVSDYRLSYRADWNIRDFMPTWTLNIDADLFDRSKLGVIYPYFRRDDMMILGVCAQAERNIFYKSNLFSVGLALGYNDGLDYRLSDGSYIPDPSQNKPKTSDMMLGREKEFLMNTQLSVSPSFRYSRKFKKLSLYTDVAYAYRRSLDEVLFLQGRDLHTFDVSIGIIL